MVYETAGVWAVVMSFDDVENIVEAGRRSFSGV